jgi:hypothetical protein
MAQFTDLQFMPDKHGKGCVHEFANGYSVSVVRNPYSYGGDRGLYELAVLLTSTGRITYATPVAPDDVLGSLEEADVTRAMQQVEALPPTGSLRNNE